MGEWSKAIGEYGERTVENFLRLAGWGETPKGVVVDCLRPEKHSSDGGRQTHGIDFYFSYLSPLVDSTRKNIHVSSKYTASPYPKYPSSNFKEFIAELSYTVECFKYSPRKTELDFGLKGYAHVEEEGVLFWLSNDTSSNDDLISEVSNNLVSIESPLHAVYVVDNKRISFLIQAYSYCSSKYPGWALDVFYPNTGKNILPGTKKNYGKVLPVEYLNTSILPLRLESSSGKTGLVLFTIDSFSKEDLFQLLGLAQELSSSWSTFIMISFPDYDELQNGTDVREALLNFENRELVSKTTITSYMQNFKSINQ